MVRVSRKEWPVTQLTEVYGMLRVPRNLDSSLSNCPVLVEFLWFVVNCVRILSVPFLESWLRLLLIRRGSKLKNSATKIQSRRRIEESNTIIVLSLSTDRLELPVLSIYSDSTLVCLFICASLSLFLGCSVSLVLMRPLVGLRPPSNSFLLSFRLTMTAASLSVSPRHDSRRRSLLMLVLSHSDTHHLNRHMVGCGRHDILIQPYITVLFLSKFSPYLIQLRFWWLSYSKHWFHLVSIQYSVRHSDPSRNHQSCYQKPFISTIDCRQAYIQRDIFCFDSSKVCEFIAIDSTPTSIN
jgi:hypothetical protein